MKKITVNFFVLMFFAGISFGISQTLNQAANWPNSEWTLTGSFNSLGLISNPTVSGNSFTYDDDTSGNGSSDTLILTSPVIDLTAANDAGENWVSVSGEYIFRSLGEPFRIEVYDADAMTWSVLQNFTGNSDNTDFQTCTGVSAYTSPILDISGFTATQLAGFQYRFYYIDTSNNGTWLWGFCLTSPTIVSAAPPVCLDPSALNIGLVTDTTAELGWTENGEATIWNIEIVNVTAGNTVTGTATNTGVSNPFTITGLTANTTYEYYVQADCGGGETSAWVGPFSFTTLCEAVTTFPWTEDFESISTPDLPSCWNYINNNSDTDFWKTFDTYGTSSSNAAG
ncbi:fibronectin type III domain-containing protein, partial [Bizionia sediminis]